jgi:hypothetical protein
MGKGAPDARACQSTSSPGPCFITTPSPGRMAPLLLHSTCFLSPKLSQALCSAVEFDVFHLCSLASQRSP